MLRSAGTGEIDTLVEPKGSRILRMPVRISPDKGPGERETKKNRDEKTAYLAPPPDGLITSLSSFQDAIRAGENRGSLFQREPSVLRSAEPERIDRSLNQSIRRT